MSTGIDYSKWDQMVADMSASDADNDDDDVMNNYNLNDDNTDEAIFDEELSSKHAKVTRLKQPTSVTIGPSGVSLHPVTADSKNTAAAASSSTSSVSVPLSSLLTQWTHNGGVHALQYVWTQNADELIVRFLIPRTAKAKHVHLSFDIENNRFRCVINCVQPHWTVDKTFSRKLKESTEEEAKLEWELCDVPIFYYDDQLQQTVRDIMCDDAIAAKDDNNSNNKHAQPLHIQLAERLSMSRFLKIAMDKEKINDRIIEWWENVFVDDDKIDLQKRIKDRKTDANKMRDVWQNAHQQFKAKVATIEPQEIHVPEQEEDEDDDDDDDDDEPALNVD